MISSTIVQVPLDFKSPFDELVELRQVLTTREIADLTGLRRETISRARPDSRFRDQTERALADLYGVVSRMRAIHGEDLGQLGAILGRPQTLLDGRSIADLLREGRAEVVIDHLATPASSSGDQQPATATATSRPGGDAVEAFLAADPQIEAQLPEIEAKLREYFAPVARLERGIIVDYEGDGEDVLYLWAHNDRSFEENEKQLMSLLERERDLLQPVRSRLNVGFV